jgi:hypothetical protein
VQEIRDKVNGTNHLPKRVIGKDGKSYPANLPHISTQKKLETIQELASQGLRSEQIGAKIGIKEQTVKVLAKKANIPLPDALIGKVRRLNINRILDGTVSNVESMMAGLDLINADLNGIDPSKIEAWTATFRSCISALNGLISKLKRHKSNGQQNN